MFVCGVWCSVCEVCGVVCVMWLICVCVVLFIVCD